MAEVLSNLDFLINITCFDFVIKLLKLYALKCETDIVVENKIWIRFFAQKQFHFNECLTEWTQTDFQVQIIAIFMISGVNTFSHKMSSSRNNFTSSFYLQQTLWNICWEREREREREKTNWIDILSLTFVIRFSFLRKQEFQMNSNRETV